MAFTTYKAILKYSMRRGQIPKQCTYKSCNGSDFCGKHRNFIVNESRNDLSYPATEPCIVFLDVPDDTHCCICKIRYILNIIHFIVPILYWYRCVF